MSFVSWLSKISFFQTYLPSGRGGAGNGSFSDIIINKHNQKTEREDSNYEKYKGNK